MKEISCQSLTFSYSKNSLPVFSQLDIVFERGKTSVVLGVSGSGKSTLLRCLLGLERYQGSVLYDGRAMEGAQVKDRNAGYVSQSFILNPRQSIFENIAYPLRLMHVPMEEIKERVVELAKDFDIEATLSRKPREISLGQQQRTALAKALIKVPDVLFLDEPFAHLDPLEKTKILTLLKSFLKNKTTVVYITHDFVEATQVGDFIYLMAKGRIEKIGTPFEALRSDNPLLLPLE